MSVVGGLGKYRLRDRIAYLVGRAIDCMIPLTPVFLTKRITGLRASLIYRWIRPSPPTRTFSEEQKKEFDRLKAYEDWLWRKS
jgi:hypothetical protein